MTVLQCAQRRIYVIYDEGAADMVEGFEVSYVNREHDIEKTVAAISFVSVAEEVFEQPGFRLSNYRHTPSSVWQQNRVREMLPG